MPWQNILMQVRSIYLQRRRICMQGRRLYMQRGSNNMQRRNYLEGLEPGAGINRDFS